MRASAKVANKIKTRSQVVCCRKMFTIQMPSNSENDCVHVNISAKNGVRDRIVKGQKTFTKHNGISYIIKTWKMSAVFIHQGAKNSILLGNFFWDYCQTFAIFHTMISFFHRMGHQRITCQSCHLTVKPELS